MGRKKGIAAAFCSTLRSSLADVAGKLLSAYGLKPDLDDDSAFVKVLQVATGSRRGLTYVIGPVDCGLRFSSTI